MPKRIIYHPPAPAVIEQYVRKLCEQLAARDTSYLSPEVTVGLTRFLQVAGSILAKDRNKANEMEEEEVANPTKRR